MALFENGMWDEWEKQGEIGVDLMVCDLSELFWVGDNLFEEGKFDFFKIFECIECSESFSWELLLIYLRDDFLVFLYLLFDVIFLVAVKLVEAFSGKKWLRLILRDDMVLIFKLIFFEDLWYFLLFKESEVIFLWAWSLIVIVLMVLAHK